MEQAVTVPSQIDVVAQIIRLTQEDKIRWSLGGPDSIGVGYAEDRVEAVFFADYKGTRLKLVSIANKDYFSELASALKAPRLPSVSREPIYHRASVLELLDERGKSVWWFPQLDMLEDLERAVRYQVANIKGFVDSIFAEA